MLGIMSSDVTQGPYDSEIDDAVVGRARLRYVGALAVTLAAILVLIATIWIQVAGRFDSERIRTDGDTIRNAMVGMLSMGLPIGDFIGFQAISSRVLQSNPTIHTIAVRDLAGTIVLSNPPSEREASAWPPPSDADSMIIDQRGTDSRMVLPVHNRFGKAGTLELVFERTLVHDLMRNAALAGLAAIALLILGLSVYGFAIANPEFFQSRRDMIWVYAVASLVGLALAVSALLGLAADKARETAGAYAQSLGARLGEAVELGIDPADLGGLDEVVREYRESNSVIGYVALLEGNRIAAATGLDEIAAHWTHPTGYFDAVFEVRPRRLYTPRYRVVVGIHWRVATGAVRDAALLPGALVLMVLAVGVFAVTRLRIAPA